MQTQRILLTIFMMPLLAALCGCQPEGSAQQPKATTAAEPGKQQLPVDAAAVAAQAEFTQLAKDTGCFACHAIEKKLLGPAWKDVAKIYHHDTAAEEKLMNKIAKGGSGVWGKIAMPGYPDLGEAKRRTLAKYILSLE